MILQTASEAFIVAQYFVKGAFTGSYLSIVSFVRDYEEIMAQRNAESKEPKERKPYEGMNFEKLIEKATPWNELVTT